MSSGLNRQTALCGWAVGQQSFRELPATEALIEYAEPPNREGVTLGIPGTLSSSTGVPTLYWGSRLLFSSVGLTWSIWVPEGAAAVFVCALPEMEDSDEVAAVAGNTADVGAAVEAEAGGAEMCAEDGVVGSVAVPIDEADKLPGAVLPAVADPVTDELHPATSKAVATAETANPEGRARDALRIKYSRCNRRQQLS